LAIRLTFGEALVAATAVRKATIRNEMAIIRKITSLIAVPDGLGLMLLYADEITSP
jgi:hypothetical protein